MICEPNESDREILCQAVSLLGQPRAEPASVSDVLAAIRGNRAEAVICSLAVLSGEDASTYFLRSTLILSPDIRFVVVASQRQPEDVVEAIRIGAGKVIFRPLGAPAEVAESLRAYLGGTGGLAGA
jgi:DNA-binding NarL/FixJ family response regulator